MPAHWFTPIETAMLAFSAMSNTEKEAEIKKLRAEVEGLKRDHIGAHRVSIDTIRLLEAENARLRATLEPIAGGRSDDPQYDALKALGRLGEQTGGRNGSVS